MAKFNNYLITYELNWNASNINKMNIRASSKENAKRIALKKLGNQTVMILSIKA